MTLEETYYEINRILGNNAEPLESVRLVETYRRYLKPETVRVVLLAESHVFTSDEDRRIAFPPIDDLHHPRQDGTPQFWKVLYACDNRIENLEDFRPVLQGTSFPQRLQNKIRLLKNLRAKGIWLVDASIVAVYGAGVNVSRRSRTEVIRRSWESYTKQVVTSANPECVSCVGKGIARAVENDLRAIFPGRFEVIPQPNARLSSKEHIANFQRYFEFCCS